MASEREQPDAGAPPLVMKSRRSPGRWRERLNWIAMPRDHGVASRNPPRELRLPGWYVACISLSWLMLLSPLLVMFTVIGMKQAWAAWADDVLLGHDPWFYFCFIPCQFGFGVTVLVARRRLKRRVGSLIGDGAVPCIRCHYPLNGLQASGRCPECGHPYEIAAARDAWARLCRILRIDAPRTLARPDLRTPPPAPPEPAALSPDR